MKRMIACLFLFAALAWTGDAAAAKFEYIGSQGCKMCHKSSKKGDQWGTWENSVHAKAFETLKSDKSAEIAKKMGLKTAAHEAPECLACHTTGYGMGGYEVKDAAFWAEVTDKGKPTKDVKRMSGLQAVGCESCHGPGSEYKSKKQMNAAFIDAVDGATIGLVTPTAKTCIGCHNEKSPTFNKEKPFVFEDRVKEIAHPYPAEKKAEIITKLKSK